MKAPDLVELAARNLRESVLRNSLTTLGIAVGVASLVAMLSLGVGLQELASRRLIRSGLFDTIVVFPRTEFQGLGRPERTARPKAEESRPLDQNARHEFEGLPHVVEVYPEVRFAAEARFGDRSHFVMAASLAPSARENSTFENMTGQFFSTPAAEEAILQAEFARELAAQPSALVGQEIVLRYAERRSFADSSVVAKGAGADSGSELRGWGFSVLRQEKKLRIVGIIEAEPGGFRNLGRARLFIPLQLAEGLRPMQSLDLRNVMRSPTAAADYLSLIVRVASPVQVQAAEDAIKAKGFGTFSLLDATRSLRRFFAVLDLFLGVFGSLALAVASLGIVNTLVMAILERRREIGIMKALGASDRDIKRLFFAEAGAMGLLGGMLGVALGWAIGRVINFGANIYLRQRDLPPETLWSVPWWLVTGAIVFAVVVSLGSGLYPAARAAQLDPVQALRYE